MIRMATKADIPAILGIYGPYILNTTYTFEYTVPTEAEFTARFDAITAQFPWLVWEEKGRVLGYAYGSAPFERAAYGWCSEISVYLSPEAQGKGFGKRLCAAVEEILWRQGYQVIFSLFLIVGSTMQLDLAWAIADTLNGLMAIPNLVALIALSPVVAKLTKEYFASVKK